MNIIGKHLNILDYALSLLLRHRLKNCGVLIVFALVIFLFASFQLVTSALKESAGNILATAPDITIQQLSAGRQVGLPVHAEEVLGGIFGIAGVRKRIWGYYFDEKNGANYTIIGLDPADVSPVLQNALQMGRLPQQNGEVVIAAPVAQSIHLENREAFSLFRPDLTLKSFKNVGLFKQGTALVTDDVLLMTRADAGDLFGMEREFITDLLVDVANASEVDTIARKIADGIPGSRVLTRKQILKTYDVVFSWRSGFGSVCLLASLFAFVILAWDRASGLSPLELREMGILKIIGWQTSDIMLLRFWESAVIALLSFLIGYSLAWVHVAWAGGVLFRPILLGWSVLQPSYLFSPPFYFADILLVSCCSVIPYLAATIVPAWRSAMVRPDSVM